jgi:hypothetical protein
MFTDLQIICSKDINLPVHQIFLQKKKKGVNGLYLMSYVFLPNFAVNNQDLNSINLISPYNKIVMALCEITITQCNNWGAACTGLQLVLILPVIVSLSSAVIIFTKNVYLEDLLETCILYYFSVRCCDVIVL